MDNRRPWCYTTDPNLEKETCDVPECSERPPECRPFPVFDNNFLPTCRPYLDEATHYFLADTPWIDSPLSISKVSLISVIAGILETALNPTCASNTISLICRSVFKECKQVTNRVTGSQEWLPSLMCRSECQHHADIWNGCLDALQIEGPEAKTTFDRQMVGLAETIAIPAREFGYTFAREDDGTLSPFNLLGCRASGDRRSTPGAGSASSWLLGQWSGLPDSYGHENYAWIKKASFYFPEKLDPSFLYPEVSSTYTYAGGHMEEVPCFVPGVTTTIPPIECPHPFVRPIDDSNVKSCVRPCPVQAYSDREYTLMWGLASGTGLAGFAVNVVLVVSWTFMEKEHARSAPYQLKVCVYAGLLYGIVGTLPMLLMKYDLPCGCETEECTGTSVACAVNRLSHYIVLAIMINVCAIAYQLAATISSGVQPKMDRINVLCTVVPILIASVGYALEVSDIRDGPNAQLNIARHAFSCSMRSACTPFLPSCPCLCASTPFVMPTISPAPVFTCQLYQKANNASLRPSFAEGVQLGRRERGG
jgi:hypothetical protein